jgi:hypothetical protein
MADPALPFPGGLPELPPGWLRPGLAVTPNDDQRERLEKQVQGQPLLPPITVRRGGHPLNAPE